MLLEIVIILIVLAYLWIAYELTHPYVPHEED